MSSNDRKDGNNSKDGKDSKDKYPWRGPTPKGKYWDDTWGKSSSWVAAKQSTTRRDLNKEWDKYTTKDAKDDKSGKTSKK